MTARSIAMARAVGVIVATTAIVTGITFAQLNTTATLSSTTISTATADLTVWNGSNFAITAPGFTVTNLIPGTPSAEQPFYLKNGGGSKLGVTAHIPTTPTYSGIGDWNKVYVHIANDNSGTAVNTTIGALLAGEVTLPGSPLSAGAQGNSGVPNTEGNFKISFNIDSSTVSGSSANIGAFDIVLTGTVTP